MQKNHKRLLKELYANKMDNLEQINKFLGEYNIPSLNKEERENMNKLITSTEIETVIKNSKVALQEYSVKYLESNEHLSFLRYF